MGWVLPAAAALVTICWLCVQCTRQIFFHPLSRYPGPRIAALTDWFIMYFVWRGDLHIKIREWHEIYGEAVRTGPDTVSYNSATANEQINAVRARTVKSDGYQSMSTSRTTPNTISAIDKKTHSFKRRIQSQVLSEAGLKTVEGRVLGHVQEFVDYLGSDADAPMSEKMRDAADGWGPSRNMSEACNFMTYNVISDLCYGESLDLFKACDLRWFPGAVALISRRVVMGMLHPKFNAWKLDRLVFLTKRSKMLHLAAWVRERGSARAARGNDVEQRDIFYSMMNTADPKTGDHLTSKDLWLEAMMVLIAGSDTTSTAMAGTLHHLLHSPQALAEVSDEVRSRFETAEDITPARVAGCKFVRACIDEAMRLTPPVVHGPPRRVEAGGVEVKGEYFGEGTILQAPIYSLHRNEEYFEAPDEYRPWRWMVEGDDFDRASRAFVPFHVGPYSCVGWRLAVMELTTALARIVFSYDMRLSPGAHCCGGKPSAGSCPYQVKGWMTSIAEGPVAQFKARSS